MRRGPTMLQLTGTRLGPYELYDMLGRGGMGAVYRARHVVLDRTCAIKVLPPNLAGDESFVQRFRREATIAGSLRHPNIVDVYDIGSEGDLHYIVMQLVEGQSLRDIIGPGRAMPIGRATRCLRPLADALDYAHAHGVVHRDIKPGNIIVGPDDTVTLVDFGIARAATGTRLTQTGLMVGTPSYMAPEVITGNAEGPSADRYALGVVAFEMLTGRLPFEGVEGPSLIFAIVHKEPTTPRTYEPDVSDRAERAIMRQLDKEPAERFPTAMDFVTALTERTTMRTGVFAPDAGNGQTIIPSIAGNTTFFEAAQELKAGPATRGATRATAAVAPPVATPTRVESPSRTGPLLGGLALGLAVAAGAVYVITQTNILGGAVPKPADVAPPTAVVSRPPDPPTAVPPTAAPPLVAPGPPTVATKPAAPPPPVPAAPPPAAPSKPSAAQRVADANAAIERKEFEQALAMIAELRRADPSTPGLDNAEIRARVGFGQELVARSDFDRAIGEFDQALKLSPNESAAIQGRRQAELGKLWAQVDANWDKNEDAVVGALEAILKIDPNARGGEARRKLYAVMFARGDRLAKQGDKDGAIAALNRAREVFPEGAEAQQLLAQLTATPTPIPEPTAAPAPAQPKPAQPAPAQPQPAQPAPAQPAPKPAQPGGGSRLPSGF
jgi:hypothetical protein